MIKRTIVFAIIAALPLSAYSADFPSATGGGAGARVAYPANNTPGFVSPWGQIQNVQSYSSNPFFSPNSPYNQRMPVPVYAKGTDVKTAECQSLVSMLVANACAPLNNCVGKKIADVRPQIMVQLSSIPGGNYATSCVGYIDDAFNEYVAGASALKVGTGFPAAFPSGGAPVAEKKFEIANPYKIVPPGWVADMAGRGAELANLQKQTADSTTLVATNMPTTYADVSFEERMKLTQESLQPWAAKRAYQEIKIEDNKTYMERIKGEAEARKGLIVAQDALLKETDICAYYKKNPEKCWTERGVDRDNKNKTIIEQECRAKKETAKLWIVASDPDCVCKLQMGASDIELTDALCNRTAQQQPGDAQTTGEQTTDGQPTGEQTTDGQPTGKQPTDVIEPSPDNSLLCKNTPEPIISREYKGIVLPNMVGTYSTDRNGTKHNISVVGYRGNSNKFFTDIQLAGKSDFGIGVKKAILLSEAYVKLMYGWDKVTCFASMCSNGISADDFVGCTNTDTLESTQQVENNQIVYPKYDFVSFEFDDFCDRSTDNYDDAKGKLFNAYSLCESQDPDVNKKRELLNKLLPSTDEGVNQLLKKPGDAQTTDEQTTEEQTTNEQTTEKQTTNEQTTEKQTTDVIGSSILFF